MISKKRAWATIAVAFGYLAPVAILWYRLNWQWAVGYLVWFGIISLLLSQVSQEKAIADRK